MSDSNSSEDEGRSRFREVCDPSFSIVFDRNISKNEGDSLQHCGTTNTEANQVKDYQEQETRESFLLMSKIKESLSRNTVVAGECMNGWKVDKKRSSLGTVGHCTRRNKTLPGIDTPSPLSAYLAKQLTGLLEKSIGITVNPDDISDNPACRDETRKPSICLLKNFSFENITKQGTEGAYQKRRKVKQKKFSYFDSSDEDDVVSNCRILALSPQSILDKSDDYPWPHPKNIRYLERYKVKDRGANGSVLAVACNETCTTTARTSADCISQEINGIQDCMMKGRHEIRNDYKHVENIEDMNGINCLVHKSKEYPYGEKKMKKKDTTGSEISIGVHSENVSHKAQTGSKEGINIAIKKRKQSRKRGKKRKNSENIISEKDRQTSI